MLRYLTLAAAFGLLAGPAWVRAEDTYTISFKEARQGDTTLVEKLSTDQSRTQVTNLAGMILAGSQLSQRAAEGFGNRSCDGIGCAARRETHHEAHGLGRIRLRKRRGAEARERHGCAGKENPLHLPALSVGMRTTILPSAPLASICAFAAASSSNG